MNKALITSLIAGNYQIYDKELDKEFLSKPRGVLKIKGLTPKVGDYCLYSVTSDNLAIIEEVLPRKNDLIRPYIANIDQAFVIFSVKEPDLNLNLLDKFLVTLEYNNIKPIIIFNKMDLLNEKELNEINSIIDYYHNIGYVTYKTSATNLDINGFDVLLKDKISVFTGQSGVGKSSLLNAIDDTLNLSTDEISHALSRGKHTTRSVTLYKYHNGFVADTPGFGTINFKEFDEVTLSQNFVDFFNLSSECKYKPCLHINEPSCKVKECINNGSILKSRYENYLLFIEEIKKNKKDKY